MQDLLSLIVDSITLLTFMWGGTAFMIQYRRERNLPEDQRRLQQETQRTIDFIYDTFVLGLRIAGGSILGGLVCFTLVAAGYQWLFPDDEWDLGLPLVATSLVAGLLGGGWFVAFTPLGRALTPFVWACIGALALVSFFIFLLAEYS